MKFQRNFISIYNLFDFFEPNYVFKRKKRNLINPTLSGSFKCFLKKKGFKKKAIKVVWQWRERETKIEIEIGRDREKDIGGDTEREKKTEKEMGRN